MGAMSPVGVDCGCAPDAVVVRNVARKSAAWSDDGADAARAARAQIGGVAARASASSASSGVVGSSSSPSLTPVARRRHRRAVAPPARLAAPPRGRRGGAAAPRRRAARPRARAARAPRRSAPRASRRRRARGRRRGAPSRGSPRPRRRNTEPACVPAGTRMWTRPSSTGTSTSVPSAASTGEIGRSIVSTSPSRPKNGCGRTRMMTCRSPEGPPRRPGAPSRGTRWVVPPVEPGGMRTR